MAEAPIWITESGSLGVIPEGRFYRITLEAYDPDFPSDPTKVSYSLIAGSLPEGMQVNTSGQIEGIPAVDFKGVPSDVAEDVTSKFVIRVTDVEDRIADRTFTLTVTGQDAPMFVTPAGSLGIWFDGSEISYQIDVVETDPSDTLTVTLVEGALPEGLTIDSTGLIYGFAQPIAANTTFNFTLQVTDGKDVELRAFSMFLYSHSLLTADTTLYTADMENDITADLLADYTPYITNTQGSIGTYRHDNYFAYKFYGVDLDGDKLEYYIDSGSVPPGLTLNSVSGWLYGTLPDIGITQSTYTFGIRVRKLIDPTNVSALYTFSMIVTGNMEENITWVSPAFLGTIDNGEVSTFTIEATYDADTLYYRLLSGGGYNRLPQGLSLQLSGNIVGRVSFRTFSLDGGTTTLDSDFDTRLDIDPTTFDLTYTFTVEAYTLDSTVSVTKEFTILVNREFNSPYNRLYCKVLPPFDDRALIDSILTNTTVIPNEVLYRPDDPYFGKATDLTYTHAYGLTPVALDDYYAALSLNHYNKDIILGELKTARALDENENVLYEVVYSQIIDTLVNQNYESVSKEVDLGFTVLDDNTPTTMVYPNSLENMREQVITEVGQVSNALPLWMLSKQEDGTVLGFTPAWVIAYTLPNKSELVKYNINSTFGVVLNLINFTIDRYSLDARLSTYWDTTTQSWITGASTTFDRTATTADSTQITADYTLYTTDKTLSTETIFDGGSTKFAYPVDVVNNTDSEDSYVKFADENIINQ